MPCKAGLADTKACIQSCLHQTIGDIAVLTIDDGSEDCGPYLRSLRGPFIQIAYQKSRGLNHAWNEGLRFALDKLQLPHALVINNDLVLRPDTYEVLVADGGGFVTGVGVDTMDNTQRINPSSKTPHPSFSCFLIRKEVWQATGEFDETFWAWASDGDYHLRMDALGIDVYAIDLPFYHRVSGTLKNTSPQLHEELCRLSDRDRETFLRKWGCEIGSDAYYARFNQSRDNRYQSTGRL
jgi:GT2 family glycosyltransferase